MDSFNYEEGEIEDNTNTTTTQKTNTTQKIIDINSGVNSSINSSNSGGKLVCKYGSQCYQTNQKHLNIFYHPNHPTKPVNERP